MVLLHRPGVVVSSSTVVPAMFIPDISTLIVYPHVNSRVNKKALGFFQIQDNINTVKTKQPRKYTKNIQPSFPDLSYNYRGCNTTNCLYIVCWLCHPLIHRCLS